jgi:hemerythrin
MPYLQWKPAYSLGIAPVDLEHREMIEMINACYQRMEQPADEQTIERFLGEIHSGIAAHFALEEQMMRQAAYPELVAHKDDHEALLDDIRDMMDHYHRDPEYGLELLRERLADWFGRHFSTFDARLHEHFGH